MKRTKHFLLLLAATALIAVANAQTINGDLNHSGKLEVSDVTHLISNYLTGTSETISGGGDPFTVNNSLVVGTWYKSKNESITFCEDGTTDFLANCTYKFKPYQGYILFYNADGIPMSSLRVPEVTTDYLAVLPAGSDVPVIYMATPPQADNGTENGHAWVDLGLSVKWATMNIGASFPEDYGDYYAWGETETKRTYNWRTYKYSNGSDDSMTKYNNSSDFGTVDNKTTLELSDDAAHVNWGGTWRMPTYDEMYELWSNCTRIWTTQNGKEGYTFVGPNGNSIFLPAAGCHYESSLYEAGSIGYYWSSSINMDKPCYSWHLYFYSPGLYLLNYCRFYGQSVRAVCQ